MAGKEVSLAREFCWQKSWEVDFSKIKVLDYSALFIFGRDKTKVFNVLVHVFPLTVESDVIKLKKNFEGRISYY